MFMSARPSARNVSSISGAKLGKFLSAGSRLSRLRKRKFYCEGPAGRHKAGAAHSAESVAFCPLQAADCLRISIVLMHRYIFSTFIRSTVLTKTVSSPVSPGGEDPCTYLAVATFQPKKPLYGNVRASSELVLNIFFTWALLATKDRFTSGIPRPKNQTGLVLVGTGQRDVDQSATPS